MHCHPKKKTTLIVIEGRALFSTLNESWELLPLDTMVMDSEIFHSTQCVSKDGLRVFEFESPPMKHDLIRLEDKYGRAQRGYEGIEFMTIDTGQFRFFNSDLNNGVKNLCNKDVCIKLISGAGDLKNVSNGNSTLAVILNGNICSGRGEILYAPTNVLSLDELREIDAIFNNLTVMLISHLKGALR